VNQTIMATEDREDGPAKERRKQPLYAAVQNALQIYCRDLNGEEPHEVYDMVLEQVEAPLLEIIMDYAGGNQTKAARYLGLNRGTLRKKLKQHGLGS
jgi:Fis family transcriptional regulator